MKLRPVLSIASKTVDPPLRITNMIRKTLLGILIASASMGVSAGPEPFEKIKAELSSAGCTSIAFVSILESDIFNSIDSTMGQAYIAQDGQYQIRLGPDEYVSNGEFLYSYSPENNQVTVERVAPGTEGAPEVSFITHLDEFYQTAIIRPGQEYRLVKKPGKAEGLPDSLRVFLNPNGETLERLEYFDINDELNRIIIESLKTEPACDSIRFQPEFPDSVEVIELF